MLGGMLLGDGPDKVFAGAEALRTRLDVSII